MIWWCLCLITHRSKSIMESYVLAIVYLVIFCPVNSFIMNRKLCYTLSNLDSTISLSPVLDMGDSKWIDIWQNRAHNHGDANGTLWPILEIHIPGQICIFNAWWRLQIETFPALLAICALNSPVFPAQRPVTQSFNVFFDLRLNKRLSKQSWGWRFETSSHPVWRRHCNGTRWGRLSYR